MQSIRGLSLILFWIFLLTSPSRAQVKLDATPGEMQAELKEKLPDTDRLMVLFQIAKHYLSEPDPGKAALDSSNFCLREAQVLYSAHPSSDWQPEIYCLLGKYYWRTGMSKMAQAYFQKADDYIRDSVPAGRQATRWRSVGFAFEVFDTVGFTRIDCLEKMAAIARQQNDKQTAIRAEEEIADTHMKQGRLDLAEGELLQVVGKYQAIGYKKMSFPYILLSKTHRLKGNYNKALYYSLLSIKSLEAAPDSISPASTVNFYGELAELYDEMGLTEKSIGVYRIIFKLKPPEPFDFYMFRDAGIFVRDLIKEKKAQEAYEFLVGLEKRHPPIDLYSKASLTATFANYYNAVGDSVQADRYTRQLIGMAGSFGKDNEVKRDAEYQIGLHYFVRKQWGVAAAHFQAALEEANYSNSAAVMRDIHLELFRTDSAQGNYVSAIRHLNQYRYLNDSIFTEIKNRQFEEVQAEYESEKKEQDIRLLQKEGALQQGRLMRERATRNWILGGLALLVIIVGLLLYNSRLKQRTNLLLETQKDELRDLVKEKEWLLKEIHHRVKNNLHMIAGLLDAQSGFLKNPEAVLAIRDSQHRVSAMSLIHQKLYQSADLSLTDMAAYIHELVAYLADSFRTSDKLQFRLQIEPIELGLTHSVPIGLILNEAITNCIKYAFPSEGEVFISLRRIEGQRYLLIISDNGVGLPAEFSRHSGSMGMSLMEGLSEDIGGIFSIVSDKGTKITVEFSYP